MESEKQKISVHLIFLNRIGISLDLAQHVIEH